MSESMENIISRFSTGVIKIKSKDKDAPIFMCPVCAEAQGEDEVYKVWTGNKDQTLMLAMNCKTCKKEQLLPKGAKYDVWMRIKKKEEKG